MSYDSPRMSKKVSRHGRYYDQALSGGTDMIDEMVDEGKSLSEIEAIINAQMKPAYRKDAIAHAKMRIEG